MEKHNIIEVMTGLVERKMKGYKSDFYNFDLEMLKAPNRYIWILRELGTYLMKYDDISNVYDYFYNDDSVDFYDIVIDEKGMGSVKLIPFQKREKLNTFTVLFKDGYDNVIYRTSYNARTQKDAIRFSTEFRPDLLTTCKVECY